MLKHLFWLILCSVSLAWAQAGRLNVGFDLDDTVLFSRDAFLRVVQEEPDKRKTYAWVNTHDHLYSKPITPMVDLLRYFHENGHKVYIITARKKQKPEELANYLSKTLGIPFVVDENLFFSPGEKVGGFSYPTKSVVMERLDIDIYYGDSDGDIIAAIKAGAHPVRVIRHASSVEAYSKNYFGDTRSTDHERNPFSTEDLELFYRANVGFLGESIYPIVWQNK